MNRKTLYWIVYFALCTFILILPSLYNGYPLIHQDSGHYLISSKSLQTKAITPPGYVFFIRAVTWQTAIWMIVVMQALMLNFYLFFSLKSILAKKDIDISIIYLFLIALLSIFTGMGWHANYIMPDLFTAFAIFSVYFFIRKNSTVIVRVLNGLIIFWACISHFSNNYIILLVSVFILLIYLINNKFRYQIHKLSFFLIIPILISANLFIRSYNYFSNNGFILSRTEIIIH